MARGKGTSASVGRSRLGGVGKGRFEESKHPRSRGGKFASKPKPAKSSKPTSKSQTPKTKRAQRSDTMVARSGTQAVASKSAIAKAAYNPAGKFKQDWGERNEAILAKKIRGRALPDNEAFDVLWNRRGGGAHGIEVKSMTDTRQGKIAIKGAALQRKLNWSKTNKAPIHTVAFDDRDVFGGGKFKHLYSGHKIYYRRGVGSFRTNTMYKVKSFAELNRLLNLPTKQLPQGAR